MLWSINERLGGNEGLEIEPLGLGWYDDLMDIDEEENEAEEQRKQEREAGGDEDIDLSQLRDYLA